MFVDHVLSAVAASREAAQASHHRIAMRTADRDTPIPEHLYMRLLREERGVRPFMDKGGLPGEAEQAGRGPHHQYPKTVALYIATFVNTTA